MAYGHTQEAFYYRFRAPAKNSSATGVVSVPVGKYDCRNWLVRDFTKFLHYSLGMCRKHARIDNDDAFLADDHRNVGRTVIRSTVDRFRDAGHDGLQAVGPLFKQLFVADVSPQTDVIAEANINMEEIYASWGFLLSSVVELIGSSNLLDSICNITPLAPTNLGAGIYVIGFEADTGCY